MQEKNASGTPTANLLTGGTDQVFSRTDGAGARYPLTDALGSTVALTDAAGSIQTSYTYEPFGKTTVSGSPNGATQQFTGRENDGPLYYYRSRYYHPTFGRFASEDSIGLGGGPNQYAYAGNAPTEFTDPTGRIPPVLIGIGIACAGGAAFGALDAMWRMFSQNLFGGTLFGQRKTTWGDVGAAAAGGCALGGLLSGVGSFFGSLFSRSAPAISRTADELAAMRAEFDSTVRPGYWRTQATTNAGSYGPSDIVRMKAGKPPIGSDGYPMELHHSIPLSDGGSNDLGNLIEMTRTDHRLGDNFLLNHPH